MQRAAVSFQRKHRLPAAVEGALRLWPVRSLCRQGKEAGKQGDEWEGMVWEVLSAGQCSGREKAVFRDTNCQGVTMLPTHPRATEQ